MFQGHMGIDRTTTIKQYTAICGTGMLIFFSKFYILYANTIYRGRRRLSITCSQQKLLWEGAKIRQCRDSPGRISVWKDIADI